MKRIQFFNIPPLDLVPSKLKDWVEDLADDYGVEIEIFIVNVIGKEEMLKMNQNHLNHDTHTDILTFDYGNQEVINAELFVSKYMCALNAGENAQSIENEYLRLISHGFLHTLGYSDKKPEEKRLMTKHEDRCLQMFHVKQ
jgi:rRNA maturation RNase YbeY